MSSEYDSCTEDSVCITTNGISRDWYFIGESSELYNKELAACIPKEVLIKGLLLGYEWAIRIRAKKFTEFK